MSRSRRARRRGCSAPNRGRTQPQPQQDYPSAVHPLHRYAAQHAAPEPDYQQAPPFADDRSAARSVAL